MGLCVSGDCSGLYDFKRKQQLPWLFLAFLVPGAHGEGFGAQQALPVAAGEPGGWILPMLGSEAGTQKHSGALGCAREQETQRCPGDLGGNSSFWRQALPG